MMFNVMKKVFECIGIAVRTLVGVVVTISVFAMMATATTGVGIIVLRMLELL